MDENTIKYEDLVTPDDSIKALIGQLEDLNKTYGTMLETVKSGAKDIVSYLKTISTATSEGRTEIDEATAAANRLTRAQKELKFSMSETGKEVAWLKAQTASQNKMSVEMRNQAQALIGSYDKLKLEIKDNIALWKSLSETERTGAFGKELLQDILNMKVRIADLDSQLKIHVQSISEVQKAEQRLAFLRSEEGKRLLELKKQIRELTSSNKEAKPVVDEVARATERYNAAASATNVQIQQLNQKTQEANRLAKLTAKYNNSAEGSYNQLAALYEINKIKLNAMSHEQRYATAAGKDLEQQTLNIYKQMIRMQEATGNHRLSVGNYKLAWNGLGNAMNQVIRELPAATMGVNTFFLAISNNIPVLIDEIDRVRQRNKLLAAEGKTTTSVVKTITGAIFSWQTALILCLTALSMHGKEIWNWISALVKGRAEAVSYTEAVDNINKELEKTNGSYGQNLVSFKKLSNEWKKLTSDKERQQWIKDNKSEFDKLDVSVRNVSDAENIFVDHTDTMVAALKARAKAAAAMKLAADKYEEALIKEAEAEAEAAKTSKGGTFGTNILGGTPNKNDKAAQQASQQIFKANQQRRIQGLKDEAKAAEKAADQYFKMAQSIVAASDADLKDAGIEPKHKDDKNRKTRTPHQRDITDQIWRNDLTIRKKYELSLSELQKNEWEKRRIEAVDKTNQTIREMQEKFRKNEVFLTNPDNKFKPLTEEQKAQIEQQQKEIQAIIKNAERKLQIDLTNIDYDFAIDRQRKIRQVMKGDREAIIQDIEKEKQLRLQQSLEEEQNYSTVGNTVDGEVVISGSLTPEQIAEYQRERERIIAEYDAIILRMKADDVEAQLNVVKKGTEQELELLLQRNEIARQLALTENKLKPVEERRSEASINSEYGTNSNDILARTEMTNFDEQQAAADAQFNVVKRSEYQITNFRLKAEKERWEKLLSLAKSGALNWSDAQIKQAKAMIDKLNREINENTNFIGLVGDKGLGGALLTKLGFNDDQIDALSQAASIVLDNIKAIADAEVEAAEQAVAAAEKRVEAAQNAYDAEIEGRNNGYANSVATAKKELQQEKKNQLQKQKMLEEAQRRQEAINTVVQASSLVTASANLWASLSPIPIVGPSLALAAIATMWGSFAAAKIRAAQVTRAGAEEEYGEGGLEILEGGSHASGNDIDLQTKNSKGRNMRAEGGEAMAIINKRNTRKYRRILPTIVDSINKGTFEEKFSQAFKTGDELSQNVTYENRPVDLSQLEDDVRALKHNSEQQMSVLPNGTIVVRRKNVTRFIH